MNNSDDDFDGYNTDDFCESSESNSVNSNEEILKDRISKKQVKLPKHMVQEVVSNWSDDDEFSC